MLARSEDAALRKGSFVACIKTWVPEEVPKITAVPTSSLAPRRGACSRRLRTVLEKAVIMVKAEVWKGH